MKKNDKLTVIVLVCLILASCITFGGVYAYFSARTNAISGSITLGHLHVSEIKTTDGASIDWNISNLQPNQQIGGSYKVEVDSNINYYIRILFKADVKVSGKTHPSSCGDYVADDTDILNIEVDGAYTKCDVKNNGYTAYYKLAPRTPNANTTTVETFNIGIQPYSWVGVGSCDYYMGANVTLNMQVEVLQADFLESQEKGKTFDNVNDLNTVWNNVTYQNTNTNINFYGDDGGVLTTVEPSESNKGETYVIIPNTSPAKTKEIDGETLYFQGWIKKGESTNVFTPNQKVSAEAGDEFVPYYSKDVEYPQFTFTKDEKTGEYILSGANSGITSAEIPAFKQGEQITLIQNRGFYNYSKLETVKMPTTITKIGDSAFNNCRSLTSINIPESVTSIGSSAFYNCTNLSSITIPEGVTSIGKSAFYNCTNLTSITIPEGVTEIEMYAFSGCTSLTSITIPNGVTSIGDGAFSRCESLTSINVPEGVTSIGDGAFGYCTSLTSLTVDERNVKYCSRDNIIYTKDMKTLMACAGGKSGAFEIPSGVTTIKDAAFGGCTSLTSITIPQSVTSIGDAAFGGCTNLTSITISNGVRSIGDSAFSECTSLTSINIPEGVTSIAAAAFMGCTSLTSINIPEGVTSIADSTFAYCASLTSITIPNSVVEIGSYCFDGCYSLTSVTFKDTSGWNLGYGESIDVSDPTTNATNLVSEDWYGEYLYKE